MEDFFKLELLQLSTEIEESLISLLAEVPVEQFKDSKYLSQLKNTGANAVGKQVTGINMISSGLIKYSPEFEQVKRHFENIVSQPFIVDLQICTQLDDKTIGPIGYPFHRYNLDPCVIYTLSKQEFQFYTQIDPLPEYHVLLDRKNLIKSNTYQLDKSQMYAINWRNLIVEEVYHNAPTYKLVLTFPGQQDLSFLKSL